MKKKIMFVIDSLVEGGAEKVLVDLINHLDADKYVIFLVLFEKKGVNLSAVSDCVKIYDLKKKSRYSFLRLVFQLTKLYKKIKPDAVFSFMVYNNLISILAKLLSRCKLNLIMTIQIHLSSDLLYARCRRIKKFLYKNTFKYSSCIAVPSLGVKKDLVEKFNLESEKIKVIHNPINIKEIDRLKNLDFRKDKREKYILAVGRLTKQKGYTYLLRAYNLICKSIDEKLVILGTGEDEAGLKQLTEDLDVQEKVLFLGFQKNPYVLMKNASLFVLSSLWESFAIVIPEAMACGVPIISTDCPSGPGEIITNGKNGILVRPGDEKALAEAILNLLKDKNLRKRFSIEGKRRAKDFRIEKILPQYEKLF